MEIEEVVKGVFQVSAVRVGWQLIVEDDAVTLVDAGWRKDYATIAASLQAVGHSLASIEALILTHAHVDHMGCAAELARNHDTRVLGHREESELARGMRHEGITTLELLKKSYRPSVLMFGLDALRRGGNSVDRLDHLETFESGVALDVPGSPIALHTPGHTSGSSCYHLPDRGVLITGDALATSNIYTGTQTCQLMPSEFNHDQQQAIESLDTIRDVRADVVLSGHGQPFRGSPAQAVEEALGLL